MKTITMPSGSQMKIITITGYKGGVGKAPPPFTLLPS